MIIKTNWKNGDSFDIIDDYERIKSNINTIYDLSKEAYPDYDITTLGSYDYTFIPLANFFNDLVKAVQDIYDNSYQPNAYKPIETVYVGKGRGFSAEELNTLEMNIDLLYQRLTGMINSWNRCGYETLGLEGGNF